MEIEGINFTDPVMLDPLTGEVYELNVTNKDKGCVLKEAVLADYPFIVVESETIKWN